MRQQMLLIVGVSVWVTSIGIGSLHAAENSKNLKIINTDVAALDKRIADEDPSLPILKVSYDFLRPTEGVPPSFTFYFETRQDGPRDKSTLRVCKIHVGREVYAVEYSYYFDGNGKPLKYLLTNSGVAPETPSSRDAILYGKSSEVIWNPNKIEPPFPVSKILEIFRSLDTSLSAFR